MHSPIAQRTGQASPCPGPYRQEPEKFVSVLDVALPRPGASMTLDAVLQRLSPCETTAYSMVADAVRSGAYVVVFEAERKAFPHRELMVCRL